MKLAFNGINSGFGNNGGSRTIISSSQVLEKLGHRCDIIGVTDNFKWFKHKPAIKYIPDDLDAIINIAAVDYNSTKESNAPIKACWWRGHETWSNTEEHLRYCYTDTKIKNFVNSKGLQQLLASYGADSKVIYQGIDFELWEDRKMVSDDVITVGCLYNKKTTKRWGDFVKLASILGTKEYKYIGIGDTHRDDEFLTYFKANANTEELNDIYNSCDIWFAPTELEGLHNVPIEASLCGCLIVCNDHSMNGMILDYAFPDNTSMVYERRNIEQAAEFIRNPNWSLKSNMKNHIVNNIGSREKNMKKMIKYLKGENEKI